MRFGALEMRGNMRRTIPSLVIVLAIGLIGAPAWATMHEHISLPETVDIGTTMKLKVHDCESGPGWNARIKVVIKDQDGNRVVKKNVLADDDGTTKVKIKIKVTEFDEGTYTMTVSCIHYFDAGGTGTWFTETVDFTVELP